MDWKYSIVFSADQIFELLLRAKAYLDPGSGSYFIQLLIASLMGALFFLGTYRKKIKQFLKNLFSRRKTDDEQKR